MVALSMTQGLLFGSAVWRDMHFANALVFFVFS